jgi:ketosteroid isomerase-like protein
MYKTLIVLFLLITKMGYSQNQDETAIRNILQHQITHWNEGNIEQFMHGYWENDSLVFIGKKGPVYGYNKTLNNYKNGYPNKDYMGILSFDILSVKPLGKDYYFVIGKFHLDRKVGEAEGHFTLLFRKIDGVWKIIADHSS